MPAPAPDLRALYGTEVPPEPGRALAAGRLTARLERGNLRYVCFDGVELLRAVAYVVRDRDWGTYAPQIEGLAVEEVRQGFRVGYRATCRGATATLRYAATIEGHADGRLRFVAEAVPDGDFETNRCGFVVLHPASVAGTPAEIEQCDGTKAATAFPDLIEPWQPFLSIRAIRHRAGRFEVSCRLEGDDFEMEDQRNWSDASFKTYGRPLALPWPFTLAAGEPVAQSVTLSCRPRPVPAGAADRPEPAADARPAGARFPEIGLVVRPGEVAEAIRVRDRLAEIGPQRILCAYDPTAGDTAAAFAAFADLQSAYPAAYDLECVVVGSGDLDAELSGVAAAVRGSGLDLASLAVSPAVDRQSTPPGSAWPACPPLEAVYAAARRAFPDTVLGGGMFSFFTELNRKRPPLELLDFVTHATNPIVHAADDTSVMETLETLPHITRSVRALIGGKPYRLGPSTIAMRMNPYGSRTMPNPRAERICMADDDPRQRGRFAAAWCAGYAAAIAPADVAVWVPAALTGPRGLVDAKTGRLLPVGRTVAALAPLAQGRVVSARVDLGERVAVLDVQQGGSSTVLIANLSPEANATARAGSMQPFETKRLHGSRLQSLIAPSNV
jgi:hypothetical protein